MSKEAMTLALDALQNSIHLVDGEVNHEIAIKALEEALAKQGQGEPVASVVMREEKTTLLVNKKIKPTDGRLYIYSQTKREPLKITKTMIQAAADEYDGWATENKGTYECIEAMLKAAHGIKE